MVVWLDYQYQDDEFGDYACGEDAVYFSGLF
jgi:hypothetical protein